MSERRIAVDVVEFVEEAILAVAPAVGADAQLALERVEGAVLALPRLPKTAVAEVLKAMLKQAEKTSGLPDEDRIYTSAAAIIVLALSAVLAPVVVSLDPPPPITVH